MKSDTKKGRGKVFIVPLIVYPFDVMVSICQSDEEIRGELKKRLPLDCQGELELSDLKHGAQGRAVMFSNGATLIRLRHQLKYASVKGHLAHEVFHVVEFIMDRIGIKHNIDSGEAYAYLIGYITEKIYENAG